MRCIAEQNQNVGVVYNDRDWVQTPKLMTSAISASEGKCPIFITPLATLYFYKPGKKTELQYTLVEGKSVTVEGQVIIKRRRITPSKAQ